MEAQIFLRERMYPKRSSSTSAQSESSQGILWIAEDPKCLPADSDDRSLLGAYVVM